MIPFECVNSQLTFPSSLLYSEFRKTQGYINLFLFIFLSLFFYLFSFFSRLIYMIIVLMVHAVINWNLLNIV